MALQNTKSGGKFIKVGEYADSVFLVEPKDVEEGVPNPKFGGTRDLLHADVTIFDKAALEGGKPEVLKGAILTGKAIVNSYKENLGGQFVAKMKLKPNPSGHDFYVPTEVDDAIFEKVAAYLEQREAAVDAAMASEPDFLND